MSKKFLKHCVVITCFDKNQPGFLDFSYRVAALSKEYELTIISQCEIIQSELIVKNAIYQVLTIPSGKLGLVTYILKCAFFIRRKDPDIVVLLHSAVAPISLLVGMIPTCLYWNEHPTNLIHLPTGFAPIRRMVTLALHKLLFLGAKKAHVVMPIGEDHQDDLCLHKVDPKKIVMIYMGVSDQFLPSKKIEEYELTKIVNLFYLGTVSKVRGRDVMLEAMSIIEKKHIDVHLTIVGASHEQLDYCNQRIAELGIKNNITMLGRVSGDKIPNYLLEADFGICLWEQNVWNEFNPPTKLFEYLVAGVPVLASNIRTHTRYVHNWDNGLIFDYDANSLAIAIIELHNQKHKIYDLKKSAADLGQQYLWSKLEPTFLATVRTLVAL